MKVLLRLTVALAVLSCPLLAVPADAQPRRVNVPQFDGTVRPSETGLFWLGGVDPSRNYADVRMGYTSQEIWIRVSVFDQWLWHDDRSARTPESLDQWDAVSLLLQIGSGSSALSTSTYRFVGALNWWQARADYQAAFRGTGAGWTLSPATTFTTETGWRGDALNNAVADRGWTITFRVPFSSLGLSAAPASGSVWRLGVQLHDRDAAAAPASALEAWPDGFARDQPSTWGQLAFGLRTSQPVTPPPGAQTYTIRHGLNGAVVSDAMVGGGSTCAEGTNVFRDWGSLTHSQSTTLVVQNQGDVADWPCFSKIYLDLPLAGLPAGRSVVSAALTLYQFGGSDPSQALRSLVQVFTVREPWNAQTITWNTAPLAGENVAQNWVDVIPAAGVPWPGAARTWDLSWAVAQAYAAGQTSLRLALYSADGAYHSGKYFSASETGDWNAAGRPALQVVLSGSGGNVPAAPENLRIVP